jgi:hypothetical protein
VKPTEDEKQELAEAQKTQQPDAQSTYLLAAAQKQLAEADAARKNGDLTAAKTAQAIADALTKVASIGRDDSAHALQVVQHLTDQAREQAAPPAAASAPPDPAAQPQQ